ncbi:MAG: hypothetical protein HC922_08475 [Leptolyngbyaceae cyanobacterium SM2_3_12]|nr:hypothetical protein [Leptolyngbyaceae cyanobacterium SM2_3_12]
MGCNSWGWTFLNRVTRIGAYLEQVETLPRLRGKDLQTWLHPIARRVLRPEPAEAPDTLPSFGHESDWQALAELSLGVSTTAAALWTRSQRLHTDRIAELEALPLEKLDNLDNLEDLQNLLDPGPLDLSLVKPTLPGLPDLASLDRYLLHSLLLHRFLTLGHLAQSLGESEQVVRARLQVLYREGVVRRYQGELTLNPIHYPKLLSELRNNNFLIEEEEPWIV